MSKTEYIIMTIVAQYICLVVRLNLDCFRHYDIKTVYVIIVMLFLVSVIHECTYTPCVIEVTRIRSMNLQTYSLFNFDKWHIGLYNLKCTINYTILVST